MANRIVWVSAALGVTAYCANERYKDYQCLEEEKREAEMQRDAMERAEEQRKEAVERQFRQQRQKKKAKEGFFPSMKEEFTKFVQFYEMDNRYNWTIFLQRLHEKAVALHGKNKKGQGFDLPLLEDSRNSPDEITFAAALALGDPQIIEMIIEEQKLVNMTPDLVLANITSTGIYFIWREFEEYHAQIKAFPELSETPFKYMDKDLVKCICFALNKSHETFAVPVNEKWVQGRDEFKELQLWALKLGFYLVSSGAFKERNKYSFRQFVLTNKNVRGQHTPMFGQKLYMMNFKGSFSVRLEDAGPNQQRMCFGVVETKANVLVLSEEHNKARIQFVAQLASTGMARVAARNIGSLLDSTPVVTSRRLWDGGAKVSVEHICVQSGMQVSMLQNWRGSFLQMLDTNKASIVTRLKGRLEQCIPPPTEDSDESIVKAEVSTFVGQYSRLLDLSYSVVPLFRGKPPSQWVPDKSVPVEAMELIFESLRSEQNRTRRCLEQDERERLVRSRKNMMPPFLVTASTLGVLLATFYWLAFCGLHAFVKRSMLQSYVQLYFPVLPNCTTRVLLHVVSMCFAGNMLHNVSRFLQKPLLIPNIVRDGGALPMVWVTTAILCEVMNRWWSVRTTQRTPFQVELTRLKFSCQSQYQIWKDRCAQQDFYDALKRKRISSDELVHLLEYYGNIGADNAKNETVRIPGSESELDEFLEVKVIDSDDNKDTDDMKSRTMMLSELADESIESLSNLAVGTRVDVNFDCFFGWDDRFGVSAESSALTAHRSTRGSVVASFGEVVHVLLDGGNQPIAIPLKSCTVVKDKEEAGDKPSPPRIKFTLGETVQVSIDSDHRDGEGIDPVGATEEGEGENYESVVGIVLQTYGENVLVLLGDDDEPVLVLAEQCKSVPALKSTMEEEEPETEPGKMSESDFERATTVKDAIREGGWSLKREKNHLVLERPKRSASGDDVSGKQMVTLPKTPSDRRAYRNALALLNRLNRENHVAPSDIPDREATRECMLCKETKVESDFSRSQWKKQTNGVKCKACLGHPE